MTDHDEYSGIFDDLTMADFERTTSAIVEVERNVLPAFDEFVAEQLRMLHTAWIAAETWLQPLAIIANHTKQRMFVPEEDESLGDFVERMHREAVEMKAVWTFISKRTQVATVQAVEEYDVTDPELWAEAEAKGLIQLGLVWYAERIDGPEPFHRHGQMVDDNGVLGESKEGLREQAIPIFAKILNG